MLRLDLGEIRRPASPTVLAALLNHTEEGLARYPDDGPLVDALAARHGRTPDHFAITAGTDEAIRLVLSTFVEEGARVLLTRPTFGATLAAAEAAGAFVDRVDYGEDLRFPEDELRRKLAAIPPRVAVIANPDAPSGAAPDLRWLIETAQATPRTLFLVNEAYHRFRGASVLDGPLPANLAVLRSFSKDYGLAGLRVGYVVAHPDTIAALDVVRPSYTVASTSLVAALAALADEGAVQRIVEEQRARMADLVQRLASRGVVAQLTDANFVRVRVSAPARIWAAAFAARRIAIGVAGHHGPLASWFRVSVASDAERDLFLSTFDLLRAQGIDAATRIEGAPAGWDLIDEGMA